MGTVEKGNTQIMAEMIAEETGGTLFKIETVIPYLVAYDECTEVKTVIQEWLSKNNLQ